MKKIIKLCILAFIIVTLINCSDSSSNLQPQRGEKITDKPITPKQEKAEPIQEKNTIEIINFNFPKAKNPKSPIPAKALTTEEILNNLQAIIEYDINYYNKWNVTGNFLKKWPPDTDGSPKLEPECRYNCYDCNSCVRYFGDEWKFLKRFAQFILYNYEMGDPEVAGKLAWFLNDNIPWAKYLVSAWEDYFVPRYKNFNYDHQLKIMTSKSTEITVIIQGEKKSYGPPAPYQFKWIQIQPLRDTKGVLINPYQCIDNVHPYYSVQYCPLMEYADENINLQFDTLDRGIFYLGPEGTQKTIRLLQDVSDILNNHPEKMIPIK